MAKRIGLLLTGLLVSVSLQGGEMVLPAPSGPVVFPHTTHGEVKCAGCHHRLTEAQRHTCAPCHQGPARRTTLHSLCTGCHLQRKQQALPTGPVKRCRQCHRR
ncbi:MAG: cytochrome c3 family protein [Gammaproteobacteria bacterium]|nr:cytochrome c3 family protein [Gammaproteobacteria bacterium]MDH5650661.1 cytochrome c3 family protein [Gammaproteobacteria bacterium]